jgi:HNH endonuclease
MDWKPYSAYEGVYVEITKADHRHGGAGWEFGTCLWSPTRNRAGADRYSIMRRVGLGDLVLHFYAQHWADGRHESRLAGRSLVAAEVRETQDEPPSAGDWGGMAPYYRVELAAYEPFPSSLPLRTLVDEYGDEIRGDIINAAPRFYPFNRWRATVRTVQGIYLAEATPGLYGVVRRALGLEEADGDTSSATDTHSDYVEARRLARERYYFARNPALVRAAKQHYGYGCQVCEFTFEGMYGDVGHEYIECHHKNPLSERPEEEQQEAATTGIDEVAVVCANCHRMLHRRRPALTIDELREFVSRSRNHARGALRTRSVIQ